MFAHQLGFRCRPTTAMTVRAQVTSPLHEYGPDAARGRVNQQRVAFAHSIDLSQQHLRGQSLEHHCGGGAVVDANREF